MPTPIRIIFLSYFFIVFVSGSAWAQAGKNIHQFALPDTELSVDQDFGARIVSLTFKGQQILIGKDVHPENFGSTLWTDPQSAWGWPPYETLDVKPYHVKIENEACQFESEPDSKSGLQMIKTIEVSEQDSCFLIKYQIKNISNTNQSVGAWEVTRVFPGGLCLFPAASDSSILQSSNLPGTKLENGIIWFNYDFQKIKSHTKLFAMGSEGWFAYVAGKVILIKTFEDIPASQIAKGHGEIEIYANGERKYSELENHGKHEVLKPGQTLTYQVNWYLRTLPENLAVHEENAALVSFIRKSIKPQIQQR
jgi:hypothetical protein